MTVLTQRPEVQSAAAPLDDPRQWFGDARFGVFIHLGLYTLLGCNENDCRRSGKPAMAYLDELMPKFRLQAFDADEWAATFAAAGAHYAVLTTRHTEGFCLWDTAVSRHKVTHTPCGRDLVEAFTAACRRHGLRVGLYYPICAWGYPDVALGQLSYAEFVQAQLTELLSFYGQIDLVWFDGSDDERLPLRDLEDTIRLIRQLQPGCVINDRGVNHSRYRDVMLGDYATPERIIPSTIGEDHVWFECCDAMGRKGWGFHNDQSFWSTAELLRRLTRVVSLGGNYLLNVEPDPEGRIRSECGQRLAQMGAWIRRNRDAIWKAGACPLTPRDGAGYEQQAIGVCTQDDARLYVHLHQTPASDEFILPHVHGRVMNAALLTDPPVALRTEGTESGLLVRGLPAILGGDGLPLTVRLDFDDRPRIDHDACMAERQRPVPVEAVGPTMLRPVDAWVTASNGVPLQHLKRFPNGNTSIGYMIRVDAQVHWRLRVQTPGTFDVFLDLGTNDAQAGATIRVQVGDQTLQTTSVSHGRYDLPRRVALGAITLRPGDHQGLLSIDSMPSCCSDIYGIVLAPTGG